MASLEEYRLADREAIGEDDDDEKKDAVLEPTLSRSTVVHHAAEQFQVQIH